jgi:hypothetical protein
MLLSVVCQNITRLAHPPQGGWTFWLLRLSTNSKQTVKISLNTNRNSLLRFSLLYVTHNTASQVIF